MKPTTPQHYRRPVSGNEKMYLAGADLSPPFAIQVLIEGIGTINTALLQNAVNQAAEANPGCRLALKKTSLSALSWVDTFNAPPVLEIPIDWDGFHFASAPWLYQAFDPKSGPTCQVLLLKASDQTHPKLLFRAFHGVMDAQGVQHWIYDVFRMLNNQSPIGSTYDKTDLELARSLAYPEHRPNFGFDCGSVTGNRKGHHQGHQWRRVTIPGRFPGLVARLAVILAAQSRQQNPDCPVRFMIPVDLRPHLEPNQKGTGNLSNPLFIAPQPEDSWTDIYQQVIESLDNRKEGMVGEFDRLLTHTPIAALRLLFSTAIKWQFKSSRFMATGVISNVGRIKLAEFSTPDFKATAVCFLPFDIPISPLSLVTTENDDHLELALSIPKYLADEHTMDQLVAVIRSYLLKPPGFAALGEVLPENIATPLPGARLDPRVLSAFNATDTEEPVTDSVITLIETKCQSSANAIAILDNDKRLTYAELHHAVSIALGVLLENGVQPQDHVAILLNRSWEMVCYLLAILKLGAAYVPIDPTYPKERIQYILKDSQARLLITSSDLNSVVDAKIPALFINDFRYLLTPPGSAALGDVLQEMWRHGCRSQAPRDGFTAFSGKTSPRAAEPGGVSRYDFRLDQSGTPTNDNPLANHLAYIIYTSGSTGHPKGVQIEHSQLANYINWASKVYADNKPISFPLFSSLAFDLTVTSLFTPLVTGGCIQIIRESDPFLGLQQILIEDEVDIIKLTPSHLRLALELEGAPKQLKKLIIGGEDLPTELCRDAIDRFGTIEIYNEYGPTEATVGCMIHRFDPDRDVGHSVPIGTPADNTQIYILDTDHHPVPFGQSGEIYIAGSSLARGYLNRTELTQSCFIDNPFASEKKMYKTGDFARWRSDMIVEYLGRADDQVKINGFRIELGEMRSAFKNISIIDDAVILPMENNPGSHLRTPSDSAAQGEILQEMWRHGCRPQALRDGFTAFSGKTSPWAAESEYVRRHPGSKQLYAFYTTQVQGIDSEALNADIKKTLKQQLPAHMIPAKCIRVEQIPLTVNGKVDSRALLQAIRVQPALVATHDEDPVYASAYRIWLETLDMTAEAYNPAASFYDLGGDSLLMAKLLRRVRQELLKNSERAAFAKQIPHFIASPHLDHLIDIIKGLRTHESART